MTNYDPAFATALNEMRGVLGKMVPLTEKLGSGNSSLRVLNTQGDLLDVIRILDEALADMIEEEVAVRHG